MTDSNPEVQLSSMRKVALTALTGTGIEWYDFFIYGTDLHEMKTQM